MSVSSSFRPRDSVRMREGTKTLRTKIEIGIEFVGLVSKLVSKVVDEHHLREFVGLEHVEMREYQPYAAGG